MAKHLFIPKLVNGPYNDNALLLSLFGKSYSYLVDAGDISKLSNRDILKINRIFISHTHMDHFYGFDRILRTLLGKPKILQVYGPKNIIKNVHGKLNGYTWNLVDNYSEDFIVECFEIYNNKMKRAIFSCKKKFKIENLPDIEIKQNIIYKEDGHTVKGLILEHRTPSVAYIFEEDFMINIIKEQLDLLKLPQGRWITDFKTKIFQNKLKDKILLNGKSYSVAALKERVATITEGHKITYITDILFSKKNIDKLKKHIKNTSLLFIEACFLNIERDRARERYHLTAKQAGYIAKISKAKKIKFFHISPIHLNDYTSIKNELFEMLK